MTLRCFYVSGSWLNGNLVDFMARQLCCHLYPVRWLYYAVFFKKESFGANEAINFQTSAVCGESSYGPLSSVSSYYGIDAISSYQLDIHVRVRVSGRVHVHHGHGHAAWTWTCSIDMDMMHGLGHTTWIWTCSMDLDMQHGQGHAACSKCMT